MEIFIGIDCGGTHLRVGVVNRDGQLLSSAKRNSPLRTHSADFGLRVHEIYQELLAGKDQMVELMGVGVGVPGPLDLSAGTILPTANLDNHSPIPVVSYLHEYFQVPIFLDRDTNMALRGEVWQGEGKKHANVVMLTLGTGVGGALFVDGRVDEGKSGLAGELGHMIIQTITADYGSIPVCGLGHHGCLEAFIQANRHDLNQVSFYLGIALTNIVGIFNPEMIIIGGGMVKQGNFLPQAINVMKENGMKPAVDQVNIVYAKLADLSGVYGAAKFCMDEQER